MITAALAVPTIGIGAGPACDGQVLVFHDMLGIEERFAPKFVRQYADVKEIAVAALSAFAADVRGGSVPDDPRATTSTVRWPRAAQPVWERGRIRLLTASSQHHGRADSRSRSCWAVATGCGSSRFECGEPGSTIATTAGSMDGARWRPEPGSPGWAQRRRRSTAFEQVRATVVTARTGRTYTPCLLVARTAATRDRGLMGVTDPKLAGFAGMVFAFDGDVTGTFWLGKTRWYRCRWCSSSDHGRADLQRGHGRPCPTSTAQCPLYPGHRALPVGHRGASAGSWRRWA